MLCTLCDAAIDETKSESSGSFVDFSKIANMAISVSPVPILSTTLVAYAA